MFVAPLGEPADHAPHGSVKQLLRRHLLERHAVDGLDRLSQIAAVAVVLGPHVADARDDEHDDDDGDVTGRHFECGSRNAECGVGESCWLSVAGC